MTSGVVSVSKWLLPLALAAALLAFPSPRAGANGVPQLVKLTYLDSISTWGPEDAEGVLEFSFAEGFLSIDAVGLPRLVGQAYEGWLVRSSSNEALSVGQFNAQADGTARYEAQLPPITDYSLDLFIITVQSLTDPIEVPSQQRSIGGFFSVLQPREDEGSRIDTGPLQGLGSSSSSSDGSEAGSGGETAPGRLPETGDRESFLAGVRGIALIAGGAIALLWVTVRTRKRMKRGGTA